MNSSRAEDERRAWDVVITPLDSEDVLADLRNLVADGVGGVGRLLHAQLRLWVAAWSNHAHHQQRFPCTQPTSLCSEHIQQSRSASQQCYGHRSVMG